jgi:predicted nucleotidyltransferase
MTRSKADELLAMLLARVEKVNRDPQYLFGVSKLAVFGSYLTAKEKLGDLDIAVEIGPKNRVHEEHETLYQEQVSNEGRGNMIQQEYGLKRRFFVPCVAETMASVFTIGMSFKR